MKLSLSFFLVLFATSLFASINPIDLIVQADPTSHTIILRTATEVTMETQLRIVDSRGLILHTAKLQPGQYLNSRFQLAALPAGDYTVMLSDAVGETSQPITINQTGIEADPRMAERSFYPSVNMKENTLTINYLNTTGKEVGVRLADRSGNEVFQEQLEGTPTVQRAYNLDNLPAGNYYVTVNVPDAPTRTTALRVE